MTALAPLRLAKAIVTAGRRSSVPDSGAGERPGAMVGLRRADDHIGDILDIDRTPIAGGQKEKTNVRHALQRLAGDDGRVLVGLLKGPNQERAVGVGQLVDELV